MCQHARLPDRPSYLEKALVEISPWSMAQQFGIRYWQRLYVRNQLKIVLYLVASVWDREAFVWSQLSIIWVKLE